MTFPRLFEVPEVLEVQVVPSDEVRIVPEYPATTKVLLSYATALSFSVVPEVLLYHEIPSDEVTIVPVSPTATNNGLEVVVVVVVAVESVDSSFSPQEMTVRLKMDMRITDMRFFIMFFFSNYFLVGNLIIGLLQLQQVNLLIGDSKIHIFLIYTKNLGDLSINGGLLGVFSGGFDLGVYLVSVILLLLVMVW